MNKKDYPVIVLVTGILSWVFLPLILAIVAWVMGNQALQEPSGTYTDSERSMVKIGRFLGIANIVVLLLSFILGLVFIFWIAGSAFSLFPEGTVEVQTLVPSN